MTGKLIPIDRLRRSVHKGGKQGQKQGELCLQKKENKVEGCRAPVEGKRDLHN